MQHFDYANMNLMATCGQLLSYSETISGRPSCQPWENS